MWAVDRRRVDEGRSGRDDGRYHTSQTPRSEPATTSSHPSPTPYQWFSRLAAALDRRPAPRLVLLFLGAALARGRRSVTSWIRAAKLSDQFRQCNTAVAAAGKRADRVAARLAPAVIETFVATWRPAGGMIRVVLVDEPTGWVAFFCTAVSATVADVPAAVADRFTPEAAFRDCKEVVGAGQQQVRFVWAVVGAFHLGLWTFTMTEALAWGRRPDGPADRSDSPWDDPSRRPSHADKRRALLGEEIRAVLGPGVTEAENPGRRRAAAQLGRMT